jgi:excinuclease ABC subunit B
VEGQVVIYADEVTESIRKAVDTTNRRRHLQMEYNREHNITPKSTSRSLKEKTQKKDVVLRDDIENMPKDELHLFIQDLRKDMKKAAQRLDFEEAARIRDKILIFEEVRNE